MSKRPTDVDEPAAKKRASDRQIAREDPSEDEEEMLEEGTFQRANEHVMRARKTVKVRRGLKAAPSPVVQAANPFSGFNLQPVSTRADSNQTSEPKETAGLSDNGVQAVAPVRLREPAAVASTSPASVAAGAPATTADLQDKAEGSVNTIVPPTGDQQVAAYQPVPERGPLSTATEPATIFGSSSPASSAPSIFGIFSGAGQGGGFGGVKGAAFGANDSTQTPPLSAGAAAGIFGASGVSGGSRPSSHIFGNGPTVGGGAAAAALQLNDPVGNGEEDEETVWSGDGTLWDKVREGPDGEQEKWRQRGRGLMKVNRPKAAAAGPTANGVHRSRPARLIMREDKSLRLLLNANLWQNMSVHRMDDKAATFFVINAASLPDGSTQNRPQADGSTNGVAPALWAFRCRGPDAHAMSTQFIDSVNENKGA